MVSGYFTLREDASKAGVSEVKPMSTVQEVPLDSPTVPSRFTFKFFASTAYSEDSGHGRSSSAPSERVRGEDVSPASPKQESAPQKSPVWMNRQAAASTQTLHGLGLTLLPASTEEQTTRAPASKRGPRQKPNLRLNIKRAEQPDRPPPPPPKSPRHHTRSASIRSQDASLHSRTSSVQSGISSRALSRALSRASSRASSPIAIAQSMACQPVRPIFVDHTASTWGSPVGTEPLAIAKSVDDRARNVMGPPILERGKQIRAVFRRPVPRLPTKAPSEESTPTLAPPSSRFSVATPSEESNGEGEKTPKAVTPLPNLHKPAAAYQSPAASTDSLVVPSTDAGDVPPPTPRKDSFHMQKRSDESTEQPSDTRGRNKSPTPSHFLIAASARLDRSQAPHVNDVQQPEPPARDPPKRPVSPSSTTSASEPSAARSTAPKPEPQSRSLTPEPLVESKMDRLSRVDRPTPELPFRSTTPDIASKAHEDPSDTFRSLARQTEALHGRYTNLRSDRQKLSTSIVSSLREQKAGPQYANTLLDQHLFLAAINSSMDICFAKLKSLECRKEEAMTAVIAQQGARRRHEKLKQATSVRSHSSLRSPDSGRSTPELAPEAAKAKPSTSKLRKDSAHPDQVTPERSEAPPTSRTESTKVEASVEVRQNSTSSESSDKRLTVIQPPITQVAVAEPDEISSSDVEAAKPKKIRVKGAKAAKILGLMRDDAEARPGSPAITLPDDLVGKLTPALLKSHGSGPAIGVHIPSSPFKLGLPPRSPAPTSPLPSPPSATPPLPTPPISKDTVEPSVHASSSSATSNANGGRSGTPSRASSSEDSAADETEAQTPQEEKAEESRWA